MNLNIQTTIVDDVALQFAVAMLLADDPRVKGLVPVVPEFKLQQESELAASALWTLPAASFTVTPVGFQINQVNEPAPGQRVGAGLLVEWPDSTVDSPGVSGPPATYRIHVVAFEERNVNLTPGVGIGIASNQLAWIAADILHLQALPIGGGSGTLWARGTFIEPAHDWMGMFPGIFAHRATFTMTVGRRQTQRAAIVQASFRAGQCVLTCQDPNATIYYTTDGSMPVGSNPNARVYSGAFNVANGTVVTCASRDVGLVLSEVLAYVAPGGTSFNPKNLWWIPISVADGQPAPTVTSAGITVWPFIDTVTGLVVYVTVADGQITVN